MSEGDKYSKALEAIQDLYGDNSVPVETTLSSLIGLRDELGIFIEAIESDLADRDRFGRDG